MLVGIKYVFHYNQYKVIIINQNIHIFYKCFKLLIRYNKYIYIIMKLYNTIEILVLL